MTFKKDNKSAEVQWLKKNRHFLLEIGVPESVVTSERRWGYVLLHGNDELESGWSAESLTPENAFKLIGLLSEIYENEVGLDLFSVLRKVEGAG